MLLTKILFPVLAHLAILTNAGLFNPVNRESPECANINRGQHLCCAMTIDGDQPPVVALALLAGYNLNRNSINGIACEWSPRFAWVDIFGALAEKKANWILFLYHIGKETWDVCNWTELCCQVTGL
ncbi:MAG: hypothetical protein M1839_003619, partial [Geoglossum umbratile]